MKKFDIILTKSADAKAHSSEQVSEVLMTVEAKNRREALYKAREEREFSWRWKFDMRTLTAEYRTSNRRGWGRRYITVQKKEEITMTNKQIEAIMTKAVETAYASQTEETLSQLGSVSDAVQSAIDGIDFLEVDGMTEKEAYDFYFDWTLDGIKSVL